MSQEDLAKKLTGILSLSEKNKGLVFKLFKEKLAEYIKVGEAIKVDDLGVFQLKEQLSQSGNAKILEPKRKELTLIFSPMSNDKSDNFLFINLDLEKKSEDELEFDENVFQIGIGKSLVIDNENLSDDDTRDEIDQISGSIQALLEKSEKLNDFDLWEDHLKAKESKSILDEEVIEDESQSLKEKDGQTAAEDEILITEDVEIELEKDDLFDDEFEAMDEEELINEYIDDAEIVDKDNSPGNIGVEKEITDQKLEDFIAEGGGASESEEGDKILLDEDEKIPGISEIDNIEMEEIDLELDLDERGGSDEKLTANEKIFDAPEDDLSGDFPEMSDKTSDEENIASKIELSDLDEDSILSDETTESVSSENEVSELAEELDTIKTEDQVSAVNQEIAQDKKSKKGMMMILIPAFIIIASVASYYLFFNNSVDVSEIQKNVPGIQKSVTEDKGSLKSDKLPTESSDKLLSEKAAEQPDITEQNKNIKEE